PRFRMRQGKGYRFTRSSAFPDRPKGRLEKAGEFFVTWGGVGYCLFIVVSVTYFARFIACPGVFGDEYCVDLNLLATFLVTEIMANLGAFLYFRSENRVEHWQRHSVVASLCRTIPGDEETGGSSEMDEEGEEREKNRGKFCVSCNRYAPIRSHHCPLCNVCVLRKDHHCYITGACVGLGNQRYFIIFLFWATIGCAVGARYIASYMDQEITPWYPFGWVYFIAPVSVGRWLLGYCSLWVVWTTMVFSFACTSALGAFAFFVTQVFYTLHGYTMFEYHSLSIREAYEGDGKSVGERLRLVFGPYWLIHFIFPAFWLKQKLTPEIADNLFRVRSKLL
ncbi:hypothetical protein PMAYCL1PPCAC_01749, partial [Pristionchus mayeri]